MSYVLYFSNYCNNSKNIINKIIKEYNNPKDIHWACIDNRSKEGTNTYITLKNGTKLLMPDIINRVPALLSLVDYKIYYGNDIIQICDRIHNKLIDYKSQPNQRSNPNSQMAQPQHHQQQQIVNDEPEAYSLGNSTMSNNNVLSDQYSAWTLDSEQLLAKGDGGVLQMHNYVNVNYKDSITTTIPNEKITRQPRMPDTMTIESLQKTRDLDMTNLRK
jgi:hypothetical protein